jgi:hypothetical protein
VYDVERRTQREERERKMKEGKETMKEKGNKKQDEGLPRTCAS